VALATLAIALPGRLPLSAPPLVSLDIDALTLLAFGVWLAWLAPRIAAPAFLISWRGNAGLRAALGLFGLMLGSVAVSVAFEALPAPIGLRYAAALADGAVVLVAGVRLAAAACAQPARSRRRP
jgi:hypothetical protein